MRSIRLSLILYFLLLMGAALAGVAYFCYQSTQEALAAKESSTTKLWIKQFDESQARVEAEFDDKLEARARKIGGKAVWYDNRLAWLKVLGMIGTQPQNNGYLAWLLPLAESAHFPPRAAVVHAFTPYDLRIQPPHSEDEPTRPVVEEGEFYQTYEVFKERLLPAEASGTLGGFHWQLTKDARSRADKGKPFFDEVKLPAGQKVRRITLRFEVGWKQRGLVIESDRKEFTPKGKGFGGWFPPLPPPGEGRPTQPGRQPILYLQFGADTSGRDRAIAELRSNLGRDLAVLSSDLDQTRRELRTQLLWLGLGAFAALVVGGFVLVWLGLSPLKRLSDAVSQVSERDFHLPIDQTKLPGELKPIAGRLAETLDQLKAAFGREKQAAADISHELRTPVAALLTRLEIALRKQRSAEEYREVLVDCRDSGQQISSLVERLLALARLDAGADLLRPRDVDMNVLMDQCAALVRPLAEARGLRLSVHHNGPANVHADPDKLREVLTNLLHNAIEYNKPDGSIDVKVERSNGHLDMEVRDTGIGITPEARQHIFERFFRADPSRQADTPHAGLGLAIVKGYVDLMGGAIDVQSTVGEGSTFKVRLPVGKSASESGGWDRKKMQELLRVQG